MDQATSRNKNNIPLIITAWLSILLISDLPDMIFKWFSGAVPPTLPLAKTGFLILFTILCLSRKSLKPLLPYSLVMLAFLIALRASETLQGTGWWKGILTQDSPSFTLSYLKAFIPDTGVMLVVLITLWAVKKKRSEFFLVRGQLDARIEPVRWLGIGEGKSWKEFGWIFAVIAALGVAVPTLVAINPSTDTLLKALAYLPSSLFFAAVNAFNEEIYFRVALLATLPAVVGRKQALLINVVFFGLAHYLYGSPPGVTGFLMTGFLAWILGKSILETRGLFWAWLIHFAPDVVIFFSYAIARISP